MRPPYKTYLRPSPAERPIHPTNHASTQRGGYKSIPKLCSRHGCHYRKKQREPLIQRRSKTFLLVEKFVVYKPETDEWTGGASFERRNNAGLFVLSVAADGTVANVAVR
jgi:hypothetical protein